MSEASGGLAAFLADPARWGTDVLALARARGDSVEAGFLFPGSPHVQLDPDREGGRYLYPTFEAIVSDGWRLPVREP